MTALQLPIAGVRAGAGRAADPAAQYALLRPLGRAHTATVMRCERFGYDVASTTSRTKSVLAAVYASRSPRCAVAAAFFSCA